MTYCGNGEAREEEITLLMGSPQNNSCWRRNNKAVEPKAKTKTQFARDNRWGKRTYLGKTKEVTPGQYDSFGAGGGGQQTASKKLAIK